MGAKYNIRDIEKLDGYSGFGDFSVHFTSRGQFNWLTQTAKDAEKSRSILNEIFANMERVNGLNYTAEDCYKDIEKIYLREVGGNKIFGGDNG